MSTKDYGCYFCEGKSQDYEGRCNKCGECVNIKDHLIGLQIDRFTVKEVIGRGFSGWTLLVSDDFRSLALKITPLHRLSKHEIPYAELKSLAQCSPHRNIVQCFNATEIQFNISGKIIESMALFFEFYEDAKPLRKLLADAQLNLSRADVIAILSGIASGLHRMHNKGLWHHDLHDDNILVRNIEMDENLAGKFEPKIIDFGSAKPQTENTPERVDRSDYVYFSKHIYNLVAKFEANTINQKTPMDRMFSNKLRKIAQRASDPNVSRRNLNFQEIYSELKGCLTESITGVDFPTTEEMMLSPRISFNDPLENTNALTLSNLDIALLFRDSLKWRDRIESSEPVIIVGPRGCGKTMLLRSLSMTTQVRNSQGIQTDSENHDRIKKIPFVGYLVSGGQLRTPFIRSSYKALEQENEALAEDFCREYINLHFGLIVLRTVIWLKEEEILDNSRDDLGPLMTVMHELLTDETIDGGLCLDDILVLENLERRIASLSNMPSDYTYQASSFCRDDVLVKIATALNRIPFLSSKKNIFLFDDYSLTVLPAFVQRAYNPVLFHLSSEVRIAISSEGEGPILIDNLHRKYKEGRELSKVNLGEIYFHTSEKDSRDFFENILEARFTAAGKGSLEQLINILGEHEHEQNFGDYICSMSRAGDTRFYGFGLLCKLCSGDVSFIIELLNSLVKGRWEDASLKLSPKAQDEIVKRFAQRQLADLKRIAVHGPHMYQFSEELGKLIRKYLLDSKNKGTIDERLRIEIEGAGELSEAAQNIHEAVLRHSVLVAGGSGKSRQGLPTRKLFFRRLFAPCFPFSPSRAGCIPLTVQEYEQWLLNPSTIASIGGTSKPKPNEDKQLGLIP